MQRFEREYKQLNDRQRRAVDSLDGPVMVIAGPGTGKTQLLSMRVANILAKTDTSGHEVLCLTFTDKAATNMRERLVSLIGSNAHSVVVKTFHSFGAEIINLYPEHFWQAAKLAPAPDAIQFELIHKLLKKLPLSNPLALRFGGNPTLTRDVKEALKYTKEAGLTPEKLSAIIDANIAYLDIIEPTIVKHLSERVQLKTLDNIASAIDELPDQPIGEYIKPLQPLSVVLKDSFNQAYEAAKAQNSTKPISTWKRYWVQKSGDTYALLDERKRNIWWHELSKVYKKYRTQLHTRGYFDYADMIVEVISQLEQNEELRTKVQERFQYVLIDEFQDTNEAQMRLSHLVADHHGAEGKPNIMVVGDDDQAIYKFQGAELNNLLNFRRSYPQAEVVVLEDNYRSHQSVLDLGAKIIDQAQYRLTKHEPDINKHIKAVSKHKQGIIEHRSYATRPDQFYMVASDVKKRFSTSKGDIAVIARTNESLRSMAATLLARGVPVRYEQRNNVLDHGIVRLVIEMSRLVEGLRQGDEQLTNQQLAELLRHPVWGINPQLLWRLAIKNRNNPHWLDDMQTHKQLKALADWFIWLSQRAGVEPLPVLLENMLGLEPADGPIASPIKDYYINQRELSTEYVSGLSAVRILRNIVNEISRSRTAALKDLLDFVEIHEQNQIIIADESEFVSSTKAVHLLTAHKAKGLEFDSVYILDCIERDWTPRSGSRKPPVNLPLRPAGDEWDDYVRLMFVATTRAVSNVIYSSYRSSDQGREVLPTPIISSIFDRATIVVEPQSDQAQKVLESALKWPRLSTNSERLVLEPVLDKYSLSVTHLLNFLDVTRGGPEYYFERNLLKLPEAKTPAQAHGTAVHAAFEYAQRLVNDGHHFDIEKVSQRYLEALSNEHIDHLEFERWSMNGPKILRHFFTLEKSRLIKGSQPERKTGDIDLGLARINGTLDRIDVSEKEVSIVDYKTGKPLTKITTTSKAEGIKAWKHRTQLSFYALIAGSIAEFGGKHIKTKMMYVHAENDRQIEQIYDVSPEDIKRLKLIIAAVWKRVQKLDFPNTGTYEQSLNGIKKFEDDLIEGKI